MAYADERSWTGQQRPTVLYFHGNAGDMASRLGHVKALQGALDCNVFLCSYRGYGKSTGTPDEDGLKEDAQAESSPDLKD